MWRTILGKKKPEKLIGHFWGFKFAYLEARSLESPWLNWQNSLQFLILILAMCPSCCLALWVCPNLKFILLLLSNSSCTAGRSTYFLMTVNGLPLYTFIFKLMRTLCHSVLLQMSIGLGFTICFDVEFLKYAKTVLPPQLTFFHNKMLCLKSTFRSTKPNNQKLIGT